MAKNDKAINAARVEAGDDFATPTKVTWRGATFEVPGFLDWPVDVMEAAEKGHRVTALRNLLGESQWATFHRVTGGRPTARDFADLDSAIGGAAAAGAESVGESSASDGS